MSLMLCQSGVKYSATVTESLKKHYIQGCISNIIDGKLNFEIENSASIVNADFDPYDDSACDNVVLITINGKSVVYEY